MVRLVSWWIYVPTKGVSATFAVIFAISGIAHIWQNNIKRGSWRLGLLIPWASIIFADAFDIREYGAFHPEALKVFIASTVLFFSAPPVYTAIDYILVGRALFYIPYLAPMHPGRVVTTFIGLDAITETIACNGASYSANASNTPSARRIGFDLVKASLILLLATFALFLVVVVVFHLRCLRAGVMTKDLRILLITIYFSGAFIMIRNIIRTIMYFNPYTSLINRKEVFFWIFEALPMLANTLMMNIFPPTKYLPKSNKIYLAKDGKTELEGPGFVDRRHFLVTLFDPMDFAGLITGKDKKDRFWEEDGIGGPRKGTGAATHVVQEVAV